MRRLLALLLLAAPAHAEPIRVDALFEFHSGFWMNLHHVLFELGRRQRVAQGAQIWGPPPLDLEPVGLDEAERKSWRSAVDRYAALADKDLLTDPDLGRIKKALANGDLPPEVREALERAAPGYRRLAWPAHDQANHRWVQAHAADLQRHGPALAADLVRHFAAPWPAGRVRVDVVAVANWAGAYTSIEPIHVTVASLDPRNQDRAGLEILFHETSHGLSRPLQDAIAVAAKQLGVAEPKGLWHAALFYIVGETLRRRFPGYVPYGLAQHVYGHGWERWLEPLGSVIPQYFDGKLTLDAATRALVRQTSQEANP